MWSGLTHMCMCLWTPPHTPTSHHRFNARSIGDEVNIFRGLDKNPVFLAIIVFTVVVQYAIVQVRGRED